MNDDQLPEWAQRRKAKDEAKRLREEADRQTEIAGSLRIQHEAPQIVSDLLSELQVNVEVAKKLGFSGGVTRKSEPVSDHIGHVEVILPGAYPRVTSTNIFYKNGDDEINFQSREVGSFKLVFMVHQDSVRLRNEHSVAPMTSREAAEWLVEGMCDRVSKK